MCCERCSTRRRTMVSILSRDWYAKELFPSVNLDHVFVSCMGSSIYFPEGRDCISKTRAKFILSNNRTAVQYNREILAGCFVVAIFSIPSLRQDATVRSVYMLFQYTLEPTGQREIHTTMIINYAGTSTAWGAWGALPLAGLLLPHRTPTLSPSTSSPDAHACAASSADARSLKFTKAHLDELRERMSG
jgi:hypothetical protein